jgi:hypothetical protein
LKNQEQKSLFWAYELYYSGFETELFAFLQKIYFDCFYTTNPSFYKYFLKKQKEWNEGKSEIIPAAIIKNLLIRPYTLDILLLKHMTGHFEIDLDEDEETPLITWLQEKNYLFIAEYIVNRCTIVEKTVTTLTTIVTYFKEKGVVSPETFPKKTSCNLTHNDIALLTTIQLFSTQENRVVNKKLYVKVKEEEITRFKTVEGSKDLRNDKLLKKVYQHGIDTENYLSLFSSKRDVALRDNYFYRWEYYASFSPLWADRIQRYHGNINHATKKIEFEDEEEEEDFYDHFNYEPDEQSLETQNKSIQPIVCKRSWKEFYEEHKYNGLFEPDLEYLEEFDNVTCE